MFARACSWCGTTITGSRRNTCSAACGKSVLTQVQAKFAEQSSQRMRKYNHTNHPGLTPEANGKRSQTRKRQRAEEIAWEREHPLPVELERFAKEIAPRLEEASAGAIARLTGLSVTHCARIKRGERVPHPRWWDPLETL